MDLWLSNVWMRLCGYQMHECDFVVVKCMGVALWLPNVWVWLYGYLMYRCGIVVIQCMVEAL